MYTHEVFKQESLLGVRSHSYQQEAEKQTTNREETTLNDVRSNPALSQKATYKLLIKEKLQK